MRVHTADEGGQAVVEFGLIAIVLFAMTVGLIDVGRAFYQYNALSAAARYGARWASVVGGTCVENPPDVPVSDWCNQYNTATPAPGASSGLAFWGENGNYPLQQPAGTPCPTTYSAYQTMAAANPGYFYTVSNFVGSTQTSIVGAIAQHFDTNSTSYVQQVIGSFTPGFDLTGLKVCIQLASAPAGKTTIWQPGPGEPVKVVLYYSFVPASGLLANAAVNMVASSQYVTE